jgi:hypothetical protein
MGGLKILNPIIASHRIAVDVETSRRRDGDHLTFIIGSASAGRRLSSSASKVGKAWALL